VRADVGAGSLAVVVSDGILGGGDDKWLVDVVSSFDGASPTDLAREIVQTATKNAAPEDDMTAIVVSVTFRE
jgi:stage II sporulation protein E